MTVGFPALLAPVQASYEPDCREDSLVQLLVHDGKIKTDNFTDSLFISTEEEKKIESIRKTLGERSIVGVSIKTLELQLKGHIEKISKLQDDFLALTKELNEKTLIVDALNATIAASLNNSGDSLTDKLKNLFGKGHGLANLPQVKGGEILMQLQIIKCQGQDMKIGNEIDKFNFIASSYPFRHVKQEVYASCIQLLNSSEKKSKLGEKGEALVVLVRKLNQSDFREALITDVNNAIMTLLAKKSDEEKNLRLKAEESPSNFKKFSQAISSVQAQLTQAIPSLWYSSKTISVESSMKKEEGQEKSKTADAATNPKSISFGVSAAVVVPSPSWP
jgi:hypothetical protein